MTEFSKMKKEELLDELAESRIELKRLANDASDLESNTRDAFDNLDRIIEAIKHNEFDVEEEEPDPESEA